MTSGRSQNVMQAYFFLTIRIFLRIRTPGDGIENKSFSEEVIFVGELSCGTSHIVRHSYDVVGSMLSILSIMVTDLLLFSEWHKIYWTDTATCNEVFKEFWEAKHIQHPSTNLTFLSMQRHMFSATLITVCKLSHGNLNFPADGFFEVPAAGDLGMHIFKDHQSRLTVALPTHRRKIILTSDWVNSR